LSFFSKEIIVVYVSILSIAALQEKFEDTKVVISRQKSKDKQYNRKMTKVLTTIYKALHRKGKIEQQETN
jgi:hypothetical protein